MDGRRFDQITKVLAARSSRRTFLASLLAGLAALHQRGGGVGSTNAQDDCGFLNRLCDGVCVSTSSDPFNCGNCGNICAPGATCVGGFCSASRSSPTATPQTGPPGGDGVPWRVDAVLEGCWTWEQLDSALPRTYEGLLIEKAPGDQDGFYEFSLRRRSYFYVGGIDVGDQRIIVHVDFLRDGMGVAEALTTISETMESDSQGGPSDISPGIAVPYVTYRTWGRAIGELHALAWGGRQQRIVVTVLVTVETDLAQFLPILSGNIVKSDPTGCDASAGRGTPIAEFGIGDSSN